MFPEGKFNFNQKSTGAFLSLRVLLVPQAGWTTPRRYPCTPQHHTGSDPGLAPKLACLRVPTQRYLDSARCLGLSFEEGLHACEQVRPAVATRCKLWRGAQPFLGNASLVLLGDTGVNTKMAWP